MPDTRDPVFSRLQVDHLVRGGTRVTWALFYQFRAPPPHSFQLQVGHTGVAAADDWRDVGAPVVGGNTAIDPVRRLSGTNLTTHYRVVLTAGIAPDQEVYTSKAAGCFGLLDLHDWLQAREYVRKELLRHKNQSGVTGKLLKRKREGAGQAADRADDPRTMILDPLTGEIIKRQPASSTVGTEFLGGFYPPVDIFVGKEPSGSDEEDDLGSGNVDPGSQTIPARLVLLPPVAHKDVFVESSSDLRYEIIKIKVAAQVRGVPIVGTCELRLVPYSDLLYNVDVGS